MPGVRAVWQGLRRIPVKLSTRDLMDADLPD